MAVPQLGKTGERPRGRCMRDAVDLERCDLDRYLLGEPGERVEAVAGGHDRSVWPPAKPPAHVRHPLVKAVEVARREPGDAVVAVRVHLDKAGVSVPGPLDDLRADLVAQHHVVAALVLELLRW